MFSFAADIRGNVLLWETDYRSSQQEIKFKLYLNGQESPVAPTIEGKVFLKRTNTVYSCRLYALNGSDFKKVDKAFVQTRYRICSAFVEFLPAFSGTFNCAQAAVFGSQVGQAFYLQHIAGFNDKKSVFYATGRP